MIILNSHKNLLLIVLSIIFLGSFLMYSASSSFAFYKYNKSDTYFLFKHIRWVSIGILVLLLISNINYIFFKYNATVILILSWMIMLIPILFGDDSVSRWLKIGNFSLMTTSDFSKLSIIIFTAAFIDKYHDQINNLNLLIKKLIPYLIITIGLIVYQPDLSTSVVISLIIFSLLYISGISKKIIFSSIIIGILLFVTIIFFYQIGSLFGIENTISYKQERLFSWINSFGNNSSNSQSYFSLLALANGGLFGKGIGDSVFKYNGFIPEGQTDFILAIIGEEIGFLGILIMFLLFFILFIKGIDIAKNCSNRFGIFLSIGITINIFFYLLINASYVIGFLPTTGLPIPFFSYGGSQTIFTLMSLGILINIEKSNLKNRNYKYYYEST